MTARASPLPSSKSKRNPLSSRLFPHFYISSDPRRRIPSVGFEPSRVPADECRLGRQRGQGRYASGNRPLRQADQHLLIVQLEMQRVCTRPRQPVALRRRRSGDGNVPRRRRPATSTTGNASNTPDPLRAALAALSLSGVFRVRRRPQPRFLPRTTESQVFRGQFPIFAPDFRVFGRGAAKND